tara:strand:+ start:191 stop:334 length:144 start_codon:yes stop_codon:yes gene_type:complete
MNNIEHSVNFLIKEYKRLKLKYKKKIITKEEKEALKKLASFLNKKND